MSEARSGAYPVTSRARPPSVCSASGGASAVEVHEDEVAEHLHLDGGESDRGGVEVLDALRVPGPVEAPVERVDPAVVGARDVPLSPAGARQHLVPAMLADVVEGPKRAVRAPDRDDAPVLNPGRHVAPRLAELLLVAKELPAPPEDLVPLDLEERRIDVAVRPNRRRPDGNRVVPLPGVRKPLPRQPLRHEPSPPRGPGRHQQAPIGPRPHAAALRSFPRGTLLPVPRRPSTARRSPAWAAAVRRHFARRYRHGRTPLRCLPATSKSTFPRPPRSEIRRDDGLAARG